MKWNCSWPGWKKYFGLAFCLVAIAARAEQTIPEASFEYFDKKARAGYATTVVFFGGSLTWGDGASDPEYSSFRALMQNYLQEKYPSAHFTFYDAAIGGTGSKLGMFRIDRDVLVHKPDLVFVEFTAEDGLGRTDRETLASYERVLRDLFLKGVPVVQVLTGAKEYFGNNWTHLGPQRLRDHLEFARFYRTAVGNSFPVVQNFLLNQEHDVVEVWPGGEIHPNDRGHRFIFEAARTGLEQAIREKRICNLTEASVFSDEYRNRLQFFPNESVLPNGWQRAKTLRPALTAVEISNGWMNEIVMASAKNKTVEPLRLNFNGTFVGVLGEADDRGLGFKVFVDGKVIPYIQSPRDEVWPTSTIPYGGGDRFFWHEITDSLQPGRHLVEILPVFEENVERGELRIESVCVAGPDLLSVQNISTVSVPLETTD